jgi:hypothetical protein
LEFLVGEGVFDKSFQQASELGGLSHESVEGVS